LIRRTAAAALATAALIGALPRDSRADDAARACATSFEQSQYLQKDGKLHDARAQANTCSAATCPAFVRDACQKLLADIDASQPTMVFAAQDASGADLVAVRVDLDGQPLVAQLGAGAIPIDPGQHTLRFVYGDQPPIEQQVLARVSEKNRIVRVVFSAAGRAVASPPVAAPPPAAATSKSGSVWPSLLVGALGGASVGVGVGAKSEADHLRATCAPRCSATDVSSINTRLVVSDVLLGAGVAVVGVATVMFILRGGGREAQAAAPPVVAMPGGGFGLAF
jgi:hypothetical protein